MNKKIMFILLLIMAIAIPVKIDAATIKSVNVYAPTYKNNVGDEFTVSYTAKFLNVEKNNAESDGIYLVVFELEFDDTILGVSAINSEGYDSYVYKENGKYYVLSKVNESNKNKCIDNFLACSNYNAVVTFKVLKAPSPTATIKLTNFSSGSFKIDYSGDSYTLENMKEAEYISKITKTINLYESTEVASNYTNVVTDSKPIIDDKTIADSKKIADKTETDPTKSTNNYLMSLTVEGYELDFKKDRYTYKITIPKEQNTLYVSATPAETTSTYAITGAEDLKANNDRVKITVKSESQDEVTYTIIVEREEKEDKNTTTKSITSKLNKILLISIGIILLIIITVIIVITSNKRKLNKLMEE